MSEIAVIGLGRFGSSIAVSLEQMGHEVLGVDMNIDIVDDISPALTSAVCMDMRDTRVMASLQPADFDCVIIGIGSDVESSVIITMMLKEVGAKRVVCKASSDVHAGILQKIGADRVVFPERDSALRLAAYVADGQTQEAHGYKDMNIREIAPRAAWLGQSLSALKFRNEHDANIIAIRRGEHLLYPSGKDVINSGDVLVIAGEKDALNRLGGEFL